MKTIRNISNKCKTVLVENSFGYNYTDMLLSPGASCEVHNLFYCGKDFEEVKNDKDDS